MRNISNLKLSKSVIALIIFLFAFSSIAQQTDQYQFSVNLTKVENDLLAVELITPKVSSDKIVYRLPAMVPGTYSVYNYGRFVKNLTAFDAQGNSLPVNKLDVNSWEISNASSLYKIKYMAEDSFDPFADDSDPKNPVFEPAGTNFQRDTNYVFNNHTLFGYLDGMLNNPYVLNVTKPAGFYGATSLDAVRTNDSETFTAPGYQFLVDNPIMFSVPDTASFQFPEAVVRVAVYSPGKNITAKIMADALRGMLEATRGFLGGKLTTDRYTFIFYFTDKPGISGGQGALEHNNSSLYYLGDVTKAQVTQSVNRMLNTCAHEFYHTVTPLNLHAEQIGNFDFNNPQMSEHLWLYEGVTEYMSTYLQLHQGTMEMKEYLDDVNQKLGGAGRFNDTLPFTVMSKGALDVHKRQYTNVYQKGALIGLCLDILIRDETNGEKGLQDVINSLLQKYGKDRSFKDEDLFSDIVALTTPKIGEFFNRYVAGPERLPYKEILDKVGLTYESVPYNAISFGEPKFSFNRKTFRLRMDAINPDNQFTKDLGIKNGDELFAVNGKELNFFNIQDAFGSVKNKIKDGDDFKMTVVRTNAAGTEEKVELQAKITGSRVEYDAVVKPNDKMTDRQAEMRSKWASK